MTDREILHVAAQQSAIDLGCTVEELFCGRPVVVRSRPHPAARRYLQLPFACDLVSYGSNIVASVSPQVEDAVRAYIQRWPLAHSMETPAIHALSEALRPHGLQLCFMAEYFLPDVQQLAPLDCPYELRLLTPPQFAGLYTDAWSNALCAARPQLDMLALGAFEGDTMIGLAGCSADCDTMWQIGIDVLPAYRRQGVAAALTSRLALEILARGKVPFYCAAWCNLPSVRNALHSGFKPAWVELTAKPAAFVQNMLVP